MEVNRRKKQRYAGIIALCVLLLLIGIWCAPLAKTAYILHKVTDFHRFHYGISLNLNEDNLSGEQQKFVNVMSWLLGVDEQELMTWRLEGICYDDSIYAQLYCEGLKEPVTELYVCKEEKAVNVKMLYESIQNNIVCSYPLAKAVLPEWEYGEYLSFAQIEDIFGVKLEEIFKLEYPLKVEQQSVLQNFLTLTSMERKKGADGERQFGTKMDTYEIWLELKELDESPAVWAEGSDEENSQFLKQWESEIIFDNVEKVSYPESLMEQSDVEKFAKLWAFLTQLRISHM